MGVLVGEAQSVRKTVGRGEKVNLYYEGENKMFVLRTVLRPKGDGVERGWCSAESGWEGGAGVYCRGWMGWGSGGWRR